MGTATNADYYKGALLIDDDKTTGSSLPGASSNEFWQARFENPQNVSRIVIFAKAGTEGYFGQFGIHGAALMGIICFDMMKILFCTVTQLSPIRSPMKSE